MRLFFGLALPDCVRAQTARIAQEAGSRIPGRYTLPDNHHITLAFLGEVPPERVGEATEILARCAGTFPAPEIALTGFGYFGKPQNAILTLMAESTPSLIPLNAALRGALAGANLPFDPGPFSPHVTLARHADVSTAPLPTLTPPIRFTAREACLFLSARDEENILRYTPIAAAPFENSGA